MVEWLHFRNVLNVNSLLMECQQKEQKVLSPPPGLAIQLIDLTTTIHLHTPLIRSDNDTVEIS